jgi:5-methyltetrahydrofolate--homocysteine methyltransferase
MKLIEWCSSEYGCATIVGLSNVSFGLPERSWINTAFLAMAIGRGLSMAIANPSSDLLMSIKMACDVLTAKDVNSSNYISYFSRDEKQLQGEAQPVADNRSTGQRVYDAVLKGDKEGIPALVDGALKENISPGYCRPMANSCYLPCGQAF